jgi:flavin reductase (DIM6/NTAB) family NADH-FMN oxidoreductase RutF
MVITDMHSYDPAEDHGLKHDPFNAIIAPRPIGWISSKGKTGNINLAPYSYFNAVNAKPPILAFSTTTIRKDTVRNVEETGEFVWNLVSKALGSAMNASAAHVPPDVSEFEIAGLTPVASSKISVPRVGECQAAMECKLVEIIQLKTKEGRRLESWLTLGEVVAIHIDKALLKDGIYHTGDTHPIVRAGRRGDYFEITPDKIFEMRRPD